MTVPLQLGLAGQDRTYSVCRNEGLLDVDEWSGEELRSYLMDSGDWSQNERRQSNYVQRYQSGAETSDNIKFYHDVCLAAFQMGIIDEEGAEIPATLDDSDG
jgi:hypothetical protein